LYTVLGEFVLPAGGGAWTSTLVAACQLCGVSEKNARQAIARLGEHGRIEAQRHGRHVRWTLTPSGEALLRAGAERIYAFGTARDDWNGEWLMAHCPVPESRRAVRLRLRTQLAFRGFGELSASLAVSPRVDREPLLRSIERGRHRNKRMQTWRRVPGISRRSARRTPRSSPARNRSGRSMTSRPSWRLSISSTSGADSHPSTQSCPANCCLAGGLAIAPPNCSNSDGRRGTTRRIAGSQRKSGGSRTALGDLAALIPQGSDVSQQVCSISRVSAVGVPDRTDWGPLCVHEQLFCVV
jgi:PaaX-like protein